MGKRSAFYYANLAQEQGEFDCTQPGEPPGQWEGSGAAALGLSGSIRRESFLALFSGFSLTGDSLVQNAGAENRVPGWDCVFAPPKSVSILWAIADAQAQLAIEVSHHQAVVKALQYLETNALSRRGSGGGEVEAARLVIATFQHGTNRNQEPYLHTHALILNVAVREDGSTGALHSKILYQHKMAAGAIYRAELAAELERRLGLSLEREKSWFELKDFSREGGKYHALMNLWSSRREEIEARNPVTSAQAQIAVYQTRKEKEQLPPRSELFGVWREVGTRYGFSLANAQRLMGQGRERFTILRKFQEWRALREAAKHVVRHQSHFTRKELVEAIAVAAQTRGLGSADVFRLTEKYLGSRHVVALGQIDGEERFANKRMYRLEKQLLAQAAKLSRNRSIRVAARYINAAALRCKLTLEQREALQFVTDRGNLKTLLGISGTGKTYVLGAAREAFEKSGYQVIGVAHSGQGAEKLKRQAGIGEQSELSKFLFGEKRQSITLFHLFAQLDRAKKEFVGSPLSGKTVVIVDDAQDIGASDMKRLLGEVREAGAKLVLSGDLKQPQAYRHSGALGAITKAIGSVELAEIHRQEQSWAKEVVRNIADGKARAALEILDERGLLSITQTKEEAIGQLVAEWSERGVRRPQEHLMVAEDKADAWILNRLAQCKRKNAGVLGEISVRVGSEYFHKGERVRFAETSRTYGVVKGDVGTVERIEPLAKMAYVRFDGGKTRVLNLRIYKQVELGYAVTTTRVKDLEVKHSYVLATGYGKDRSLVQMSQARVHTQVYAYINAQGVEVKLNLAARMKLVRLEELAITSQEGSLRYHHEQ